LTELTKNHIIDSDRTFMSFKKNNQNNSDEHLWQQHLDSIQNQDSAEQFFIRQAKSAEPKKFLDPENDFFVTPFDNDILSAEQSQLALDVFETKDHLVIKAPVAGIDLNDIDISLDDDVLTIEGTRTNDHENNAENYYYQECFWGRFSRSIILPSNISHQNIEASYKAGILTITIPKTQNTKSVNISVKDLDE